MCILCHRLCVCDSEEHERGVGAGVTVNATMLSATIAIISLAEVVTRAFRLKNKTHEPVCMR